MRVALGQPVIVENVSPAARAAPAPAASPARRRMATRSYTVTSSTHVINGAVFNLPYDVQKDFEPISLLADAIVPDRRQESAAGENSERAHRLAEGKSGQGRAGNRRPGRRAASQRSLVSESKPAHALGFVPYRGTAVAINDLVAGHIDLMIDAANNTLPHVRCRRDQGLRYHRQQSLAGRPRYTHGGRGGIARILHFQLAGAVCALRVRLKPIVAKLHAAVVDTLRRPGSAPPPRRSWPVEIFPT